MIETCTTLKPFYEHISISDMIGSQTTITVTVAATAKYLYCNPYHWTEGRCITKQISMFSGVQTQTWTKNVL